VGSFWFSQQKTTPWCVQKRSHFLYNSIINVIEEAGASPVLSRNCNLRSRAESQILGMGVVLRWKVTPQRISLWRFIFIQIY